MTVPLISRWKVALTVALLLIAACGTGGEATVDGTPASASYVSDDPTFELANVVPAGRGGTSNGGSSGSGGGGGLQGGEIEVALAEADIVQMLDGKLYALSKYGLTVIDATDPDELSVLGRFSVAGDPFEMYVEGDVVIALFAWPPPVYGNPKVGRILVLDVGTPSDVVETARYDMPGFIVDSRLAGDILYVVSHEACYASCESAPNTTVTSLDVSQPSHMTKVDALVFDGDAKDASWRKSVSFHGDRLYVVGPKPGSGGAAASMQVIDISDPGGNMVSGAKVGVAASIESRWQLDEHEGVLRVISQPSGSPPWIQTYAVPSAQEVTPLASVQMVLPQPETLRSVRFDGPRAYAITFDAYDPLFTIDLSDPAAPKQVGELEMPGWIYHMEPRGERLLGVGFDTLTGAGSLHVSLIDVADPSAPKLLDRVHFGGEWTWLSESQNGIHKAFRIDDALGLIVVPYHATGSEDGVQLIDFTKDDLALRGLAPGMGRARRALLDQDRLFAISDARAQTFDISNRDAPKALSSVRLAWNATQTKVFGDRVARFSRDFSTGAPMLDVVSKSEVTDPDAGDPVDILAALDDAPESSPYFRETVFVHEDLVYIVHGGQFVSGNEVHAWPLAIAVFDVSSGKPVAVGKTVLASGPSDTYASKGKPGMGISGLIDGGTDVLQRGSTLIVHRMYREYHAKSPNSYAYIDVVDLEDPANIVVHTIARPDALGHTDLLLAGSRVVSSRWEAVDGLTGKVRFYLDSFDVSDPRSPKALESINVPGSLFAVDPAGERAITIDYERRVEKKITLNQCARNWAAKQWVADEYNGYPQQMGTCTGLHRTYALVELHTSASVPHATVRETTEIEDPVEVRVLGHGADRTFTHGWCVDCDGEGWSSRVEVVTGLSTGELSRSGGLLPEGASQGYPRFAVDSTRVVLRDGWPSALWVWDTTELHAPSFRNVHTFPKAYKTGSIEIAGNEALCSLGEHGVEVVSLAARASGPGGAAR